MKTWHFAVYLVVLAVCIATGGAIFQSIDNRMRAAEAALENYMDAGKVDIVKVRAHGRTRAFPRKPGEDPASWMERAQRDSLRVNLGGEYICTVLTGCDEPVGTVEVCTWCDESPPTDECEKEHEVNLAEARRVFGCD